MRENRPYGSEGGEAKAFPTPIRGSCASQSGVRVGFTLEPYAQHLDCFAALAMTGSATSKHLFLRVALAGMMAARVAAYFI